LMS
jgi:hypothetical protein